MERILERCALDHPHHTIPVLLGLKNHCVDHRYIGDNEPMGSEDASRVTGAQNLVNKLRKSRIKNLIDENDRMALALVDFAYVPVKARSKGIMS